MSVVGRDADIEHLTRMLGNPVCRLVTLVGMGGIGKTRIAVEVTHRVDAIFPDGIFYIPLQGVTSGGLLSSTVAEVLRVPLSGQGSADDQLVNTLQEQCLLLVLDNFEHLLDRANLLARIVDQTERVKLLVTSRAVLNLRQEWVYPVGALSVPPPEFGEDFEQYSSVQLFLQHARRVRPSIDLEDAINDIVHICRLVEGIPLAIELAASWVNVLTCREIAAEIQGSLDFLNAVGGDFPDIHRSMRAVFDRSWELLTESERITCARLAVFWGGFSREAAEQVAGASLSVLAGLVNKSVISRTDTGRYHIHELMRQYAQTHLEKEPSGTAELRLRHSTYFTDYLHDLGQQIEKRPSIVLNDIVGELDNVRAAWRYAEEQGDVGQLHKAYYALWNFYDFRGLYQEGLTTFNDTIVRLRGLETTAERALILSSLLSATGWLHIRLGQYTAAEAAFSQSKHSYAGSDQIPFPGLGTDPDSGLAMVALLYGDYEQTLNYAEHALRQNEARNDHQNLQIIYYILSETHYAQGNYETAHKQASFAYQLAQSTNSRWMMGYILITLGNIELELGHLEGAQRRYQEGMAIKQAFGDREGEAAALNQLGEIVCLQQDFDKAAALFRESEAIYRTINDRGGLAKSLSKLGKTALLSEDQLTACTYFIEALNETSLIKWIPHMLSLLTNVSRLLLYSGERTLALETLQTIINHPSASSRVQSEARRLLDEIGSSAIRPDVTVVSDVAAATRVVQTKLLSLRDRLSNLPSSENSGVAHHQMLVEPLSERELEILRLLAEGLSNQEIAQRLTLAIGTIKTHNHNIFGKLGVNDRTHAVARSRQLKII